MIALVLAAQALAGPYVGLSASGDYYDPSLQLTSNLEYQLGAGVAAEAGWGRTGGLALALKGGIASFDHSETLVLLTTQVGWEIPYLERRAHLGARLWAPFTVLGTDLPLAFVLGGGREWQRYASGSFTDQDLRTPLSHASWRGEAGLAWSPTVGPRASTWVQAGVHAASMLDETLAADLLKGECNARPRLMASLDVGVRFGGWHVAPREWEDPPEDQP